MLVYTFAMCKLDTNIADAHASVNGALSSIVRFSDTHYKNLRRAQNLHFGINLLLNLLVDIVLLPYHRRKQLIS